MTFFLSFLRTDLPISHRDFFLPIYYSYLHVCVCLLHMSIFVCVRVHVRVFICVCKYANIPYYV